jgi:hypothetical protein
MGGKDVHHGQGSYDAGFLLVNSGRRLSAWRASRLAEPTYRLADSPRAQADHVARLP